MTNGATGSRINLSQNCQLCNHGHQRYIASTAEFTEKVVPPEIPVFTTTAIAEDLHEKAKNEKKAQYVVIDTSAGHKSSTFKNLLIQFKFLWINGIDFAAWMVKTRVKWT